MQMPWKILSAFLTLVFLYKLIRQPRRLMLRSPVAPKLTG